jgi:hypothetical protein
MLQNFFTYRALENSQVVAYRNKANQLFLNRSRDSGYALVEVGCQLSVCSYCRE